jgi:ABC-type uncharacterized transport system permease subunit
MEEKMNIALLLGASIGYLTAFFFVLWRVSRSNYVTDKTPVAVWLLSIAAICLHAIYLFPSLILEGGYYFGLFKVISLIAWLIAFAILLVSLRKPIEYLYIIIFPCVILALVSEALIHTGHARPQTWQTLIHVAFTLSAYVFLALGLVQSLLLSVQDKKLHAHQPGGFIRKLPPLKVMESLLFEFIWIGFVLLTLGLTIGFLFLELHAGVKHKIVLSITAWLLFAILLWGRWQFGWRGRVALRWAVGGFIALMLAYLGTKTVLEIILGK